jgi:hypothetical protein
VAGEAQRRAAAGDAVWARLDWSRVALAGFELGAYTTMAVAGEHVRDVAAAPAGLSLRAAIALSPHASVAAGSLSTRYRDIAVPVLSVTSDADVDPLGLVEGIALRQAPFEYMPGPDKFLFSLQGLPHAGLGGRTGAGEHVPAGPAVEPGVGGRSPTTSGGSNQPPRGGGRRSGSGPPDTGAAAALGSGRDGNARSGLSPTALAMRLIAIEDVTTAFLDAYVKDDAMAREWLAADASRWLGPAASLRRK